MVTFDRRIIARCCTAIAAVALALILAACGSAQPDRNALATQVAAGIFATQTAAATVIPQVSLTRVPTSTPVRTATARPTPQPTATPRARPSPTRTPVPSPDTVSEADGTVKSAQLNLRDGPGTAYRVLETLKQGDALTVYSQTGNCDWLEVLGSNEKLGWVSGDSQYVTLAVPCSKLAVGHFSPPPPPTGLVKNYLAARGRGELKIKNGTDSDGLVILARSAAQPAMAAYIRAGDTYTMVGIPDGTYYIYFAKGQNWDGEQKRFTGGETLQRFEDTIDFTTTATQYSSWSITLYGVAGGNASTQGVDQGSFPKLP